MLLLLLSSCCNLLRHDQQQQRREVLQCRAGIATAGRRALLMLRTLLAAQELGRESPPSETRDFGAEVQLMV
jgi:hypothetical protein